MMAMSPYILLILCTSYTVNSDSHSLRYYYTGVSAPGSGLPEFSIVGYVDDQQIDLYNSDIKKNIPVAPWMKKDPEYWRRETDIAKQTEPLIKHDVKTAMRRFNQTEGFHFYQVMYGCERRDDGSITGYEQHGYDGRELIFLDTQTWTFIPTLSQAQITTEKINSPLVQAGMRSKHYLEDECITALKEYIASGREDLERRVQPQVKVSGQKKGDTMMLHCHVYGFHPRAVHVKWMKNGDDVPDYETTHTLPNPDGTYQIRVSAEVIPKEGESYSCYVDHSSLGEPLNVVWEPSNPNQWVIAMFLTMVTAVVVFLLVFVVGRFVLRKRKIPNYKPPESELQGYNCHIFRLFSISNE
ncbi:H-2 class I histocompatibility antigen, Q9 alpha chain-like isoform X2 [Bufo bufo]|uniref:H-2 class I histocompatibility antigen, Q9 alpha chain-like isoform X2 n=1 Tax=Bufo bufo TaxID=8384 RepID=UPI001ABEBF1D|nr:H-2 class I histocompatibility antigen, Q9 alpha chain-like isoform X2 [Bufo bufo]